MKAFCLFEQSGTFKNEFIKLGYQAFDFDILNDYGQTDRQIDLFAEINAGYVGGASLFDEITLDDLVLAFFPCTRFASKVPLMFRGEQYQQQGWNDLKKLEYSMQLHEEVHKNYILISKLAAIALKKGFKMVIENPYNHAHYLTMYWPIKPALIDKDRTENGDRFKKPTQYYFLNCCPKYNLVFESLEYVKPEFIKYVHGENGKTRQKVRSEIEPQYASRFIRQYLIDEKGGL